MIDKDVERAFAKMSKRVLNRFPSRRDEFDICVSLVNDKAYICLKSDGEWHNFEFAGN